MKKCKVLDECWEQSKELTLDEVHEDIEGLHVMVVGILPLLSFLSFLRTLTILGHLLSI